jgi:hypothetical protein
MSRYVLPCVTPYSAEPVLAALVENTGDYTRFVSWRAMIWVAADIWGVSWYIYGMASVDKRWLHYEKGTFRCSHLLCILMMTPWRSWPVRQLNAAQRNELSSICVSQGTSLSSSSLLTKALSIAVLPIVEKRGLSRARKPLVEPFFVEVNSE